MTDEERIKVLIPEKTYLFAYRYKGELYGLDVQARSVEEAKERVKAMADAWYEGELESTIPAGGFIEENWQLILATFLVLFALILGLTG